MKLVVLFSRLGPYHHARLRALSKKCALTAIELSSIDKTYAWKKVERGSEFKHVTLFSDASIDDKPIVVIQKLLWKHLENEKPDVVFIPGWHSRSALIALKWCLLNNVPCSLMSDSTAIDSKRIFWKEWVKSRVISLCSSALVAGAPHVKYLRTLCFEKSICTGYDVVDNEHFAKGGRAAKENISFYRGKFALPEFFFLHSGRFVEKKNQIGIIEAYCKYLELSGDNKWHLVILGDGVLRDGLKERVKELGLTKFVHFPGFIQYTELPIYYALARVYIHASTTEQWGLVVNEAMATGLPVLVSNKCGCAQDLVESGQNGFTFDPYDVESLAELMLKVASDDCDRVTMGEVSREIIMQWSPEIFGENLIKAAVSAIHAPLPKVALLDKVLLWALGKR